MEKKHLNYFWLLLISSIIIQGIVIFTFYNGEHKDVVSHIALASSIVSIILAVLAIIYAVLQTVAQKNDTTNIATEIGKLTKIVEQFNISVEKLNKLDNLSATLENSIKLTNEIKISLTEFRAESKRQSSSEPESDEIQDTTTTTENEE
jgi:ABC-type uncharacterized transport system fused permease/ATPase subunit